MLKRCWLSFSLLLIVGCQPGSPDAAKTATKTRGMPPALPSMENGTSAPNATASLDADKSRAERTATIESTSVTLSAGAADSPLSPRYSPPGKGLELKPVPLESELGIDGLETEIVLGWPTENQKPIKMMVSRATASEPYSKLIIDSDSNGMYDEEPILATRSESRGNIWSNFNATLKVKYLLNETVMEDYPVTLWITVASFDEQPKVIRISRRGFKTGEVSIQNQNVSLVLSDSNNDAVFGDGDWWELREKEGKSKSSDMRKVSDYIWVGETAYKLALSDVTGNAAQITQFDPGKTREQDELARDPFGADKKATKAEKPLEFRHDIDEAIAEAAEKKLRCFIKFETTWCGPCKSMTQYVFVAKDVVDASDGIICVKVDGDERRDLVERYAVKAYPTGLLLSADATESSRFVGYQTVKQMASFLYPK